MMRKLLVLGFALFVVACSVSLKQRLVLGLEINHTALSALDDTERSLYQSKTIPALTDQRHRDISLALAKAYRAESSAVLALKAWRSSDPAPASVTELIAVANEAWGVAVQIIPKLAAQNPAEQSLVARVQAWIEEIKHLAALAHVPVPAFVS